jgi:hypothetical protein
MLALRVVEHPGVVEYILRCLVAGFVGPAPYRLYLYDDRESDGSDWEDGGDAERECDERGARSAMTRE